MSALLTSNYLSSQAVSNQVLSTYMGLSSEPKSMISCESLTQSETTVFGVEQVEPHIRRSPIAPHLRRTRKG
ncbi:MAG: hypothetical protein ABFC84_11065 [Veillonellales bacterium]